MLVRTGLLADEFYLLAHDDSTGKPLLPDRVAGLALAAALLGELGLAGQIAVSNGNVVVVEDSLPMLGLIGNVKVDLQTEKPPRPVRDWLEYLGQHAIRRVSSRLVASEVLVRRPSRISLRSARWIPADVNSAAVVAATLVTDLVRFRPLEPRSVMLAGLVRTTRLDRDHPAFFEVRDQPAVQRHLDAVLAELSPPVLGYLLRQTEAAFASAVATQRI
jgi:hypothetical protein